MTHAEWHAWAIREGIVSPGDEEAIAWEFRSAALARFTSEELLRELRDRANRKVVEINNRRSWLEIYRA